MKVDKEKIITWRRYFHQHPELSGEEQQTALFIAQLLRSWGLAVSEHVGGGYGVAGRYGCFTCTGRCYSYLPVVN